MLAAIFAVGAAIGIEAAPTDNVTQADLQDIIERLNKQKYHDEIIAPREKRIAELEGKNQALAAKADKAEKAATVVAKKDAKLTVEEGAEVSESGKIVTAKSGKKYYVQVRSYKTIGSKKYYSAWSAKKAVTTKK